MFELIPNTIVAYILEFLDIRDYTSILQTCKKFSHLIDGHKKFWTRECLNQFLSFDLDTFSEIYDIENYREYIQQKSLSAQKPLYKSLMAEGLNIKRNFFEVLSSIGSQTQAEAFLVSYYETLKQPLLPLANLKRETISCTTHTIFQNKLSEVLYEDSGMVIQKSNFLSESAELINELENFEEKFLKEASFERDNFVKARWYGLEQKNSELICESPEGMKHTHAKGFYKTSVDSKSLDSTSDEVQSVKISTISLLDIYNSICSTITHFCGVLSHYLNSLNNIYDLLSEYCARWNVFVCSMLELEQTFKTFTDLMNKTYEEVFKGYPCYPKFSIWRLFTKIWMEEVYQKSKLNFSLNESFLRIIGNHRERNVKESLSTKIPNEVNEKNEELPRCLYVNLKTKNKKKSTIHSQNSNYLQNIVPPCFEKDLDIEKKLLSCFLHSVLDLSLNEVNIHYMDCTEIATNYPYQELENGLLMKSKEFYSEYEQLFTESPDYFCHFLKADSSLISEIVPQRTGIKLEKLLIQTGMRFSQEFVNNQLECLQQEQLEKCGDKNTLATENDEGISEFVESFLLEALEEHTRKSKGCSDFYKLPPIEIEEEECSFDKKEEPVYCKYADSKVFVKKLFCFLSENYPKFKGNFKYFQLRFEEFEKVQLNDNCIKEVNTGKNIPFEMGDVDRLFYDLDKNIDAGLLKKLAEDFSNMSHEEEKEIPKGLELPPLEEVLDQDQNLDIFDPNLDFDNIDLLSLNTSLRRAPI